jgi:hypothetical protein
LNSVELGEEISVELEALEATVNELLALQGDIAHGEPTVREKTAAAAFLAQFYTGIENTLKRISRYHGVPLLSGETWHVDRFERFCPPPHPNLPELFDEDLASALAPYRRFRHVAFHGYGFQLDWGRMSEGVANVQEVFSRVKERLFKYLESIAA